MKTIQFDPATPKAALIASFKKAMQLLYAERLVEVILYGSYARGDERPDSDIDFLVVLNDEKISTAREIDNITDATYDLMLAHRIDISFLPVSKSRFESERNPLFYFIHNEGLAA